MKKALALGFMILSLKDLPAQCDSSFFRYTGTLIYDLTLIDTNKIVAVGDNGYIIKSVDAGRTWKNIPTFQPYLLRSVYAATDSILYAVGIYKTILKSEDQGESWYPLYAKTTSSTISAAGFFNDVFFLNKNKGFIVGDDGLLISTVDGGRTWKDTMFVSASTTRLNAVTFVNDTLGFICGWSNFLYRTRNGGATWEQINVDFLGFNRNITKMTFLNASTGFAVGGNGLIIKTIDGGTTWTGSASGGDIIYYDICFINSQIGFIGGVSGNGIVSKTTDGGNSWSIQFNAFTNASSCYAVATDPGRKKVLFAGGGSGGEFLGHNGRNILCTTDSGTSYQYLSANGVNDFYATHFLNDSTGYMSGSYGLCYKTIDFGETWKPLHFIPSFLGNASRNIFFIDKKYGFATTDGIYRTTDGGNSWAQVTSPDGQPSFIAARMHFFDSLTGVVMNDVNIYRTGDAGASWSPTLTSPQFFTDLCFTRSGKGFAVGYNGKVFISPDTGTSWNPFDLNSTHFLTGVYFYDDNLGFIGTADSILYKTTDGGNTWTNINIGYHPSMRSFIFVNDSTGYMMIDNNGGVGSILKTKNGGLTWFQLDVYTETLSKFSGFQDIYVVGGRGLILKTDKLRAPGIPGYIYGPEVNCENSKSALVTGPLQGVDYSWTVSGGATQTFTQNMDTVSWTGPGSYNISVDVSNICGTGPLRQTTLVVYKATAINTQPLSQTVCAGSSAIFSVSAIGDSLHYQWNKDGVPIPGATKTTYKIDTTKAADSANYSAKVTGLCGILISAPARLTVHPADSCVTALPQVNTVISKVVLIPNLVNDHTTLKVLVRKTIKLRWRVIDANGRTMIHFDNQAMAGENNFNLSFGHVPAGVYYLVGSAADNGTVLLRFIKL